MMVWWICISPKMTMELSTVFWFSSQMDGMSPLFARKVWWLQARTSLLHPRFRQCGRHWVNKRIKHIGAASLCSSNWVKTSQHNSANLTSCIFPAFEIRSCCESHLWDFDASVMMPASFLHDENVHHTDKTSLKYHHTNIIYWSTRSWYIWKIWQIWKGDDLTDANR